MEEVIWVVSRETDKGTVVEGIFSGPADGVLRSITVADPKKGRMVSIKRVDEEQSTPATEQHSAKNISALKKRAEEISEYEQLVVDIRKVFRTGATIQECARKFGVPQKKVKAALDYFIPEAA